MPASKIAFFLLLHNFDIFHMGIWNFSNSLHFGSHTQKIPGTQVTFDMNIDQIPAGSLRMGKDNSAFPMKKPAAYVTLDAFWIGKAP